MCLIQQVVLQAVEVLHFLAVSRMTAIDEQCSAYSCHRSMGFTLDIGAYQQ